MKFLAWVAASLVLVSCAAEPESSGPPDESPGGKADGPGSEGRSHVADAVIAALDATAPGEYGRTWTVSDDNRLDAGWLVQTPPASHWGEPYAAMAQASTCTGGSGCDLDFGLRTCTTDAQCGATGRCAPLAATRRAPGDTARRLCVGHSDAYLDELHGLITSAQGSVDLTSLSPPDGRFEAALRNALTYLGRAGRPVTARFLFGAFPVQGEVDAKAVLQRLTRDVPANASLVVHVGNYRSSNLPPSWNHSKIVAVDGVVALVGGHNLWTAHYLGVEPVHDLSVRVHGPAARDAHRFADVQWRWTCANRTVITRLTGSVAAKRWRRGAIDDTCARDIVLPATTAPAGDVTVIGAGRLAWVDAQDDANQGDLALVAMLEAAEGSIRISQQDIGPVQVPVLGLPLGDWPEEVLEALGAALERGVDVAIVVSDPDASVGALGPSQAPYANGWTLEEVAAEIRDRTGVSDAALCERLHVAPIRFSADDTFPGGGAPGNHAKLVLIDDVAFHVGSQNLYPAGLTEYGYIVDDGAAAAALLADYWDPMWTESSRHAVHGATCP
jgi:phosphatidylserine/phosphatidylglycerophosphate/cardiolipin synthase-like enzyme